MDATTPGTCASCLKKFVRSSTPISANPRSRNWTETSVCNQCFLSLAIQMDYRPVETFAQTLERLWVVEPSGAGTGSPASPEDVQTAPVAAQDLS